MAEDTTDDARVGEPRVTSRGAAREVKAEMDERKIARGVAIGLPLTTVTIALVVGVTIGAPMAILVLAAGMLLGVIGLFWASLRILSGDAPLSPELEALDATAHAVDALSSRKKMLVRALKDLDNERALGKLDEEDFEQLSQTYRAELKEVLTRIDATLEPHRPRAEDAARSHLVKAGFADDGYLGAQPPRDVPAPAAAESVDEVGDDGDDGDDDDDDEPVEITKRETRLTCASCNTSNDLDATFCKKCGTSLAATPDDAPAKGDPTPKKETADEA